MYLIVYAIYGKPFAIWCRKITIFIQVADSADTFSKHFVLYTPLRATACFKLLAGKPSLSKQAWQAA